MTIQSLKLLTKPNIESKLQRMRDLKAQITELTAEKDMLQKQVIDEYFHDAEEFRTVKGLLLASYKPQERATFNQSKFREDHEGLFDTYKESKISFVFLLK